MKNKPFDPPWKQGGLLFGGIKMSTSKQSRIPPLLLSLALLLSAAGCTAPMADDPFIDEATLGVTDIQDEAVALAEGPAALPELLLPEASGTLTKSTDRAVIDYSNTADGYVMVCFTGRTDKRLKVRVAGPTTLYTYDLPGGEWTTFPLTDGNGDYKVTVYENTTGSKYSTVLSVRFEAALADEFAPFLRPNQYVNYSAAPETVSRAAELTADIVDPLEEVEAVYHFVTGHLTYDREKAAGVRSGYLPVLDEVLAAGRGICFDYAALMAGMLRSLGIPCKLVVGYAGDAYHAWISVWTEEAGWLDGVIYFDGAVWQRLDPTFASSGGGSAAALAYIGSGIDYVSKYFY